MERFAEKPVDEHIGAAAQIVVVHQLVETIGQPIVRELFVMWPAMSCRARCELHRTGQLGREGTVNRSRCMYRRCQADEHHQSPQLEPVRSPAAHVIGDDGADGLRVEGRDLRERDRGASKVVHERPRRTAQPGVHGNAETLLPRAGDVRPVGSRAQISQERLVVPAADTLNDGGSRSANSARSGSRNGARTSRPCAMLMRSDLARMSFGRYSRTSACLQLAQRRPAGSAMARRKPRQRGRHVAPASAAS